MTTTNTRFPQQSGGRTVDPILNERIVALANSVDGYLQDKLLPLLFDGTNVPEGQEAMWSGTVQRVNEGAFFGDPDVTTLVARGETMPIFEGVGYDPITYEADEYAMAVRIPRGDAKMIQSGSTPNSDIQLVGAVELMKLDREKILALLLMTLTNWRNGETLGAAAFWDAATSDPNEDLSDAVYAVGGYGQKPNVCVLGRLAAHNLRTNAAFLEFDDMTKDRTILNDERLKEVISSRYGIKHVFIGDVVTRDSGESQDDEMTGTNVWNSNVFVGYLPMSDSGVPAAGITAGQLNGTNDLIPMQKTAAGRVKVEDWTVRFSEHVGFLESTDYRSVNYTEKVFTVLEPLGYVIETQGSSAT